MAFLGESAFLDWANPITGTLEDEGGAMRHRDYATTEELVAGDSFIAGFFDYTTLTASDVVEFALAVDVASGSATVRFSGGTDPDWALDNPALATVDLGTYTVTTGTTSVPMPFVDLAEYLLQDVETIVYVEVLAGTIEVDQMRMRIWPPDAMAVGAPTSGAWVTSPAYTYIRNPRIVQASVGTDSTNYLSGWAAVPPADPGPGAAAAMWSDAEAGSSGLLSSLLGHSDESTATVFVRHPLPGGTFAFAGGHANTSSNQDNFHSYGAARMSYEVLFLGPEDGENITSHEDGALHPDAVSGDPSGSFRAPGGGLVTSVPLGWTGPVTLQINQTNITHNEEGGWYPYAEAFMVTMGTVSDFPAERMAGSFTGVDGETPLPSAPSTVMSLTLGLDGVTDETGFADRGEIAVTLPDGVITAIEVQHPFPTEFQNVEIIEGGPALILSAMAGGGFNALLTEAAYIYSVPASEYWDPLATTATGSVIPGHFLRGDPNLDGNGDRVEVNFN